MNGTEKVFQSTNCEICLGESSNPFFVPMLLIVLAFALFLAQQLSMVSFLVPLVVLQMTICPLFH